MFKFLTVLVLFGFVAQAHADSENVEVRLPSGQVLVCDPSAAPSLEELNQAITDLDRKTVAVRQFLREIEPMKNAAIQLLSATTENNRNIAKVRVFMSPGKPLIWTIVRASMTSHPHATNFPRELLGTETERTIKFPYGSCVRKSGDQMPLLRLERIEQ